MSEKELARRLGVQFTPTLLFFNEKADVVLRLNGYQAPHRMDATLDYVAAKLETKQSYADYMQGAAREAASPKLAEEPFFLKPPYMLQRRRDGKPLLVLFERTSCASCDELHREGLRRKQVAALLSKFDIARFEASDGTDLVTPDGRRLAVAAWAPSSRSITRRRSCSSTPWATRSSVWKRTCGRFTSPVHSTTWRAVITGRSPASNAICRHARTGCASAAKKSICGSSWSPIKHSPIRPRRCGFHL